MAISVTSAFSDIEGGLKMYLKTVPAISAIFGSRIFLGIPIKGPSAWPVISIHRVGGGPIQDDTPIDDAHMSIHCWGEMGQKGALYPGAKALVDTLLYATPCGTLLGTGVRYLGAYGITVLYASDPKDNRPRYVVNCVVQSQAVN